MIAELTIIFNCLIVKGHQEEYHVIISTTYEEEMLKYLGSCLPSRRLLVFFFKYSNFMVSENFWNKGVTYNKQDLFTLFGRIWPKRN